MARKAPLVWMFAVISGLTWILMIVGALVRAHGAGLACPDWPLCFGQVIPQFDAGVALEWGHRAFAGSISIGVLVGTVLVHRAGLWAAVRTPLILAWILLIVQVVLGGLTVLQLLASWTVTSHLLVGTAFTATLLWITANLHEVGTKSQPLAVPAPAMALLLVGGVLLVAQMALGGLVSSQYAGLACHTWPSCNGTSWFPTFQGLIGLHLLHRWNAIAVLIAYVGLAWTCRPVSSLRGPALGLLALVGIQVLLGILNVLWALPREITALHTGIAALLVFGTVLCIRRVVRAGAWATGYPTPSHGAHPT